jgi:hypothetical protein
VSITHSKILEAEENLQSLKRQYLSRFGWTETCNTPGSYWLWIRDFSDIDAARSAWHAEHPKTSPPQPFGVVTASIDLAISMTTRCLDEQPELTEEDGEE